MTTYIPFVSQKCVPHELIVKLRESTVGDLVQNSWLIRNIFDQFQGKIKTYLNEEKDTSEWDPTDFKKRSFQQIPIFSISRSQTELTLTTQSHS